MEPAKKYGALPALNSDTPPEECGGGLPMLEPAARHALPMRMHDHEKSYSPALKTVGGYGYMPEKLQEEQESWEQEKREKCERYTERYNIAMEEYQKMMEGKESMFPRGTTAADINEIIREANAELSKWDCPEFPELQEKLPAFAKK